MNKFRHRWSAVAFEKKKFEVTSEHRELVISLPMSKDLHKICRENHVADWEERWNVGGMSGDDRMK